KRRSDQHQGHRGALAEAPRRPGRGRRTVGGTRNRKDQLRTGIPDRGHSCETACSRGRRSARRRRVMRNRGCKTSSPQNKKIGARMPSKTVNKAEKSKIDSEQLRWMYTQMVRIREFEEAVK